MTTCNLKLIGPKNGRFAFRCEDCKQEVSGKYREQPPKAKCKAPGPARLAEPILPPWGVGSALAEIFKEIGVKPTASCRCAEKIAYIDRQGIPWAREHRAEVIQILKESYQEL